MIALQKSTFAGSIVLWLATLTLAGCVNMNQPTPRSTPVGLHVCNRSKATTWAAVAMAASWHLSATDTATGLVALGGFRKVIGWYQIEPNQCVTPIVQDLNRSSDVEHEQYFVYAYDASGDSWEASKVDSQGMLTDGENFCVDPRYAFSYDTKEEERCTSDTFRKFYRVRTGSSSDYTFNLD